MYVVETKIVRDVFEKALCEASMIRSHVGSSDDKGGQHDLAWVLHTLEETLSKMRADILNSETYILQ
jgi:hypothetical protein